MSENHRFLLFFLSVFLFLNPGCREITQSERHDINDSLSKKSQTEKKNNRLEYLLKEGTYNMQLNRLDLADSCYAKAVQLYPDSQDAYYCYAYERSLSKDDSMAIVNYKHCLSLNPIHAGAWFGLSVSYHVIKKDSLALEAINRCIETQPDFPGAIFNRSEYFLSLGDTISACNDLRHAANTGDRNAIAKQKTICTVLEN